MTYPEHLRAVLRIGVPLIGGHLAQFLIGLTDTIMMGWYGIEELAALVLGSTLFFVIFLVGSGFAWAVMPLVATAEAEGNQTGIRRVTRMGLWLSTLFAIVFLPLFWFSAPVLTSVGQDPALAEMAQEYLRICGFALVPALLVMVIKSYLAALERTAVVFWVTVAAAAANALANYMLIFGNWGAPELGISGAAWASMVVQVISLVGVVAYAVLTLPEHKLFSRIWRPDFEVMAKVSRMGVPIGLTTLAEVGLFAASSIMMGWLGVIALAAHGIVLQLASATFMIHVGLSNAATVRAGNAFGNKDKTRLIRGALTVATLSTLVSGFAIALFLVWPEPLISAFLDNDEPNRAKIIEVGVGLMAIAALFQLADGAQVLALGLLRGIQDTTVPMIVAVVTYWGLGATSAYVMGFVLNWGGVGVWGGLFVGLAAAGVLMAARFLMKARRFNDVS